MSFSLADIVPWGRSFEEYVAMFALSETDRAGFILGCGDGPAAFNAGLSARGGRVVSADPLYGCAAEEIRRRIEETFPTVMEQTRKNAHEFVWRNITSVDELGRFRQAAMEAFLDDYVTGRSQGRYVDAALPGLPFADMQFGLALCSHFLFLYSEKLSLEFHLDAIREMCRVARQARIFPLLELGARKSSHLEAVLETLAAEGYTVNVERVPYEFQKGGNEMLRVAGRSA